jgi:rapamycin-insensitive companion of mTOR
MPPSSRLEREIVAAVSNLSNHLLANQASRTLTKAKSRHPSVFSSPELVYRAINLLNTQHYRLPVRRYVYELFDAPLDVGSARNIAEAGAGIKRRDRAKSKEADDDVGDGELMTLSALGIKKKIFSDDDDGGDEIMDGGSDESDFDDEAVLVPKEVLDPALVVRGFVVT